MTWLLYLGPLVAMVSGGAALGAALGLTGLLILEFAAGGATDLGVQAVYNVLNSFTLSAVPMFILMGEVLVSSGISSRVYGAITPLFQRVPGKLLHTNIAVCILFGAVSGSSTATAAAVGSTAYPELRERGYDPKTVLGTLAAGGTLGLLIPPSLSLIIYGAWQDVSIGSLFLAGIVPGLMMAGLFMVYIFFDSLRRPKIVPQAREILRGFWKILSKLAQIWPLVILIGAVLGTIYAGLATVTEAAGLGLLTAIVLGFSVGHLSLKGCWFAMLRGVAVFGSIFFVVIGAVILSQSVSILGIPRTIIEIALSYEMTKYEILFFFAILYIILGCFFDAISVLLMTLPFAYPVLVNVGFDPVWLGVFITIMIEVAMITPPVGVNLYVLAGITRQEVPVAEIAKATVPYWVLLLVGAVLITVFPGIALMLPEMVM